MSKTEVVICDNKENSIDVGRQIDFIKQLVRERDEAIIALNIAMRRVRERGTASLTLNIARQRMRDAEESYSNAEDALHDAREKLKDYLCDEGVL